MASRKRTTRSQSSSSQRAAPGAVAPTAESDAGGGPIAIPSKRRRRRRQADRRPGPEGRGPGEQPRRLNPWAQATLWVACATALLVAVYVYLVFPARRGPGQGREVDLVLPGGESPDALAARLTAAGLLDSPRLFALYVRAMTVTRNDTTVVAGPHLVTDDLSAAELLARLARRPGRSRAHVIFPEGWTRFDMAKRLQAAHVCNSALFLAATHDRSLLSELHVPVPASPEGDYSGSGADGYLFPATYDLLSDSDPADVVRRLKAEFDKRWTDVARAHAAGLADLAATLGWGQAEVVTLASIIEKEAGAPEERSLIASVFLNRLRDPSFKRKVLQSDPTAGYGCLAAPAAIPACAGYGGRITHDINMAPENAYSTYTHEGLPPGPIANPGARSLEAVLAPAPTHYFYFFARNGKTQFAETYEAHNAIVHGK